MGSGQPFSGMSPPVDVMGSPCGPPGTAQAYVFNATVVPQGSLGYLTLWPDGSNAAGGLDAECPMARSPPTWRSCPARTARSMPMPSGITQLILDISSYFAP